MLGDGFSFIDGSYKWTGKHTPSGNLYHKNTNRSEALDLDKYYGKHEPIDACINEKHRWDIDENHKYYDFVDLRKIKEEMEK